MATDVPVPESELSDVGEEPREPQQAQHEDIMAILEDLKNKVIKLEKELKVKDENIEKEDHDKLKPIDIKDIEKPDKYDNHISKFNTWFDKFRDLLTNRHASWYKLLKILEKCGKNTIKNQSTFFDEIKENEDKSYKNIKAQSDMYAYQLKSYLRTYTDGELHARVVQTDSSLIMELMREIIYKGRNRNPNKLIDLKSKALSPPRAQKAGDLNKILTDWRHVRQQIVEEDPHYKMDDETMQTILLKIMPQDFVKTMRDKLTEGKYHNDYHGFEQELFDEVSTRKMDEESRKAGGQIGNIHSCPNDCTENDTEEYEEVEVWSEEWQCSIMGIARKRDRSRSRSSRRDDDHEDARPAKHERRDDGGKSAKGKARGARPAGPCWTCGGPHLQRDCTHAGHSKGYPISTAWSSWRPGAFPGPTVAQWNSWLPKPWKGKGKGKGDKGKGKGLKGDGKGFKGKGKGQGHDGKGQGYGNLGEIQQPWGQQQQWGPPLGNVQNSQWDAGGYYGDLLPICAVRSITDEDEQRWKTVSGKNGNKINKTKPTKFEVNISKRFHLITEDFDYDEGFPELDGQINDVKSEAMMKKTPMTKISKKVSQRDAKRKRAQGRPKQGGAKEILMMINERDTFHNENGQFNEQNLPQTLVSDKIRDEKTKQGIRMEASNLPDQPLPAAMTHQPSSDRVTNLSGEACRDQNCVQTTKDMEEAYNEQKSGHNVSREVTDKFNHEIYIKEHREILKARKMRECKFIGVIGNELDEDFHDKAENIRKECYSERSKSEARVTLHHDRPICAVPQQVEEPWKSWCPGWQYLSLTVDSGAAETVIPHMLAQDHPIHETQASRSGLNYASATGDPIPNLGEQKLPLLTQEGSLRAMTFQAAPVDRPLGSVKRMCSSGHLVVFDEEGSYVLNKLTGEVNWMREENGNYIMDLWVMPNNGQRFQRPR